MEQDLKLIRWLFWAVFGMFVVNFYFIFQLLDDMDAITSRVQKCEDGYAEIVQMLSSVRFEG